MITAASPKRGDVHLQPEDVIGLYAEIFECSDDQARDQLRDLAGLEAALARPATYAHFQPY